MSRPILPSAFRSASSNASSLSSEHGAADASRYSGPSKPTYSKRGKITIVACASCRKRKTKCDGNRPACAQCQARESSCHYDMTDEQRRLTFLRDNVEHLAEEKASLESLLYTMKLGSQDTADTLLRRIRVKDTDVYELAAEVHAEKFRSQENEAHPRPASRLKQYEQLFRHIVNLPQPVSTEITRRLRMGEEVDSVLHSINVDSILSIPSQLQDTSLATLALKSENLSPIRSPARTSTSIYIESRLTSSTQSPIGMSRWTNITIDHDFVQHLVSLYFSWHHPLFPSFSETKFRRDMALGETENCSELLVNSICAVGCLFSDREQARQKYDDGSTVGARFYDEAARILNRDSFQELTAIPAMSLLAFWQGNCNQMSSMWMYNRRCSGLALDMNLHVRQLQVLEEGRQESQDEVDDIKLRTFWGCFIADQMISLALGRLPFIPTNSISVDNPVTDRTDDSNWEPYGTDGKVLPGLFSSTLRAAVSLSKIVNSTQYILYAPSSPMSGKLLIDQYSRYRKWFEELPHRSRTLGNAPPHALSLLMYYWNSVLLLFRPFIKASIAGTDISPGKICHDASIQISELFAKYRELYGLTGITFCQLNCLITACTLHIMHIPAPKINAHLKNACEALQELAPRNQFARRGIDVIDSLIRKWNIILPTEVELALYSDPYLAAETDRDPESSGNTGINPKRRSISNPSALVPPKRQRLQPLQQNVGLERRDIGAGRPNNLLFVPFPDQPAPLLVPTHQNDKTAVKGDEDIIRGLEGLSFTGDWRYDRF